MIARALVKPKTGLVIGMRMLADRSRPTAKLRIKKDYVELMKNTLVDDRHVAVDTGNEIKSDL